MSPPAAESAAALLVCLDALDPVGANAGPVALPAWRMAAADILAQARTLGWPVAHVLRRRPGPGEGGWRPAPGLAPLPSEPVFHRDVPSAFRCSGFATLAAALTIRRVVVVGCSADGALLATAMDGVGRGFRIVLPIDAVSASDRERAGLDGLALIAGRQADVRLTLSTAARLLEAPPLRLIRGGRA